MNQRSTVNGFRRWKWQEEGRRVFCCSLSFRATRRRKENRVRRRGGIDRNQFLLDRAQHECRRLETSRHTSIIWFDGDASRGYSKVLDSNKGHLLLKPICDCWSIPMLCYCSRQSITQHVSLLKLVFDGISLLIGKWFSLLDFQWWCLFLNSSFNLAIVQILGQTRSARFSMLRFESLSSPTTEKSHPYLASLHLCDYHPTDLRKRVNSKQWWHFFSWLIS